MRRYLLISILLVALLCCVLVFCACFDSSGSTVDPEVTDPEVTDPEITTTIPDDMIGKNYDDGTMFYTIDSDGAVIIGCTDSSCTSIVVPATVIFDNVQCVVHSIGDKAFYDNTKITRVTFGEGSNIVSIGDSAFYGCTSLIITDVYNCKQLQNVGDFAFADSALSVLSLPSGIDYVGDAVLASEYPNKVITVDDTEKTTNWSTSWSAYATYASYSASMPVYWSVSGDSVVIDRDYIYLLEDSCATILLYTGSGSEIVIPVSIANLSYNYTITAIGDMAFYSNQTISSLSFAEGSGLTSIGSSVCYNCYELLSVDLSNCTKLEYIGYRAFCGANAATVYLPAGIDCVDDSAFLIYNKSTIVVDETSKPDGWSDSWVNTSSVNPVDVCWGINIDNIVSVGDFIYVLSNSSAVLFRYNGYDSEVTVPATITVDDSSYTVTAIYDNAFYQNATITSVTFAEGNSIASIGDKAFYNCTKLASISGMDSVLSIGEQSFGTCYSLSVVDYGSQPVIQQIGRYAFFCCDLVDFELYTSIVSIGECAFYNAFSGDTSIYITDVVQYIGYSAFYQANGIVWAYVSMDSAPTAWDASWDFFAFTIWGYVGMVDIDDMQFLIRNSGASLVYCSGTDAPVIPSSVQCGGTSYDVVYIDYGVLPSSGDYTDFVVPDTVTYIGIQFITDGQWYASQPDGFVYLGNWLLAYKGDLTEATDLVIPDGTVGIITYWANNIGNIYTYLDSIYIPSSVLYMAYNAFNAVSSGCVVCVGASSIPDGWSSSWNYYNLEVVWGYNV